MKVRAFITHKQSEQYADCQDRFCINPDNRAISVSDGMSQSIFPEYWAEILSRQYVYKGHCAEEDRISLCDEWMKKVEGYLEEQIAQGKNPWRLKNNIAARSGAGATICGVQFENATDWKGDVLGDSCIIKINKEKWTLDILSSEEKSFDSHPDYYDSFPEKKGSGTIKAFKGSIGQYDMLLLVSDPFSEFFSVHRTGCKELIEQVLPLKSHDDFCRLVDNWREKGMHNDDSTLCIVEFDNSLELNVTYSDDISELITLEGEGEQNEQQDTIGPAVNLEGSATQENNEGNESTFYQYHKEVMKGLDDIIQQNKNNYKEKKAIGKPKCRQKKFKKVVELKFVEELRDTLYSYFRKLTKQD